MNCLSCRNEKVCTVYREMRDANVVAEILHCPYYMRVAAPNDTCIKELDATEKQQRTIEEVMGVAKKIRGLSIPDQSTDSDASMCDVCGKEKAISTCDGCGRHICANCMVEDVVSHSHYCEECYDKMPASSLTI